MFVAVRLTEMQGSADRDTNNDDSGTKLLVLGSPEDYRVVGRMGEGTFSEVLKCQSLVDGKLYACKKMKRKYESIEQVNNLREIQALRRLNPHPNIIELKEVILDRRTGVLALICELMDMNIYELIKDRKSYLPEQRVKLYMYQLCKSIYHMHRNGIFHRDVKPENILVKDNVLKLADFGSCKSVYSKHPFTEYISTRCYEKSCESMSKRLKSSALALKALVSNFKGLCRYRAPECLLTDGFYDHKMDMWSVGCVMFEAMCLRPLFPGSNELDQVAKIHEIIGSPSPPVLDKFRKHQSRHMDFNFPHKDGSGIARLMRHTSRSCVDLISRLCAYDPDERLSAKHALRHPYFRDIREAERKGKQMVIAPSIAGDISATRLLAINKKRHHQNHDLPQKSHYRHHRPHQHNFPAPEYYASRHHPTHAGGGRGLELPQIEARSYHHSTFPSGLTSMAVSNKSTSHGNFLPSIYGEKPSAKDMLYPSAPRHHHHHHPQQHVPSHLPAITSTKYPHHTRTGAGYM